MSSTRADIITRRTYNRPLNEEGTEFETWEATIGRVITHQAYLWENAKDGDTLTPKEWNELSELQQLLVDKKVAVAGRTLWLGGTDISKEIDISQFNCTAIDANSIQAIVDIFWSLLNGAGVGFRPVSGTLTGFRSIIPDIEIIPSKRSPQNKGRESNLETYNPETKEWYIGVGDSARAWAKIPGKLLALKDRVSKLTIDFSEIRGGGVRLRNYGWISQGDIGFRTAIKSIVDIMNRRADALLSTLDILDIVNLLGTVLSTRRSAQIAILDHSNPDWVAFANAKNHIFNDDGSKTGLEHRTQSNNSILFSTKPTKKELTKLMYDMDKGGKGEPGLINGKAMKERAPWATLMNPCVVGDTLVNTSKGLRTVTSLIDKPFKAVVKGKSYSSKKGFWYTGTKKVYKLSTADGYSVTATSNHKILMKGEEWVELGDIELGSEVTLAEGVISNSIEDIEFDKGWLVGEIVGDGGFNPTKYPAYLGFWGSSQREMFSIAYSIVGNLKNSRLLKQDKKPDTNGRLMLSSLSLNELCQPYLTEKSKDFKKKLLEESESFIKGFLRGFFDADGSVQGSLNKGVSIRLSQSSLEKLKYVQILLISLGIYSKVYEERRPAEKRKMPDGRGGHKLYDCKASHELIISRSSFQKFGELIGFHEPDKIERFDLIEASRKRDPYRDSGYSKVTSIEYVGEEKVYDCTVEKVHRFSANGIIVHNCAEILLPPSGGTCNLVSIDLGKFKGDNANLYKAAKLIARANYRQSCVDLDDGILQETWKLNAKHLHLCGVSLMGIIKRPDMGSYEYRRLERVITNAAYSMAKELDAPYPKNVTTIKPEGTQSKCYDSTEGMHKPLGKYIFNNVAFSKHDPLLVTLKEANYNVFAHPYDDSAKLATLPISYDDVDFDIDDEGKEVNLESAISQLERYRMLMDSYCHQNVSCTISYDTEELPDIVDWLDQYWDSYVAVSFLKRNDPSKTAADLGYPYLPQEVVTKEIYEAYVNRLQDINLVGSLEELKDDDCASGVCPVK